MPHANVFVGAYQGGDIGYPNINVPVPIGIVSAEGTIISSINFEYEPGSNATQINQAIENAAVERAAFYGFTITPNDVVYTPFTRG